MYQFTTTNVINSQYALDYDGNILVDGTGAQIPKFAGSTGVFKVAKVGTFLTPNVAYVSKRPYTAGVKEVAQIVVPTPTSGKVYRLTVDIKLSQSTQSEYANYSLDFKKPITVEILSSGVAATDATALVAQLNTLKDRFGKAYFTASNGGTSTITVTLKEDVQRFNSLILGEETANANSLVQYDYVTVATGSVTTPGKIGFGDNAWMIRTIYIPTTENVRYFGISRDERPIMGGNYTEYVLRYSVEKEGEYGLGILAGAKSVTTHVFYVLSTLVTAFEAALVAAGLAVDTIGTVVTALSITSGNLDISNVVGGTAYVTTYTTTPSGVTGAVFTLNTAASTVAGSADWTKVTVTPAGVISLVTGHGLAALDKIAVDVTIDNFTTTKDITLQA